MISLLLGFVVVAVAAIVVERHSRRLGKLAQLEAIRK